MNINELTSQQLSQAASIQEKLDSLHKELRGFLKAITTKPIQKKANNVGGGRRKGAAAPGWGKVKS
jgi:hypothetical protein